MAFDHEEMESAPSPNYRYKRRGFKGLVFLVVVIIGGFLGIAAYKLHSGNFPSVNRSVWQAVFLTNDQVYFGRLADYNRGYVALRNVFYLRPTQSLQQSEGQGGLNLVKLGAELHGPEDTMYIPKDRILFWEDMKADSQVVQAISAFLKGQ